MKKILPILALLFLLVATPAVAKNHNNDSEDACDPNDEWKNHGAYVSCVAHEHPGGAAVSIAAHSDVGKDEDEDEEDEDEDNASPSPIVSPSPSPEVSPSPSPEVSPSPDVSPSPSPEVSPSPSPEVSPSPEASPSPEVTTEADEAQGGPSADILQKLIERLEDLIDRLNQLFPL